MVLSFSLTPLSDTQAEDVRDQLIRYWNAIDQCPDLTGVLGDLFHDTETKVTELLQSNQVDDVYEAMRLSAWFEYMRRKSA